MLTARAPRDLELPPVELGPFRGLAQFEADDRDVFFGRDNEIAAALELLRAHGMVSLVGEAGSGKRSLARAGVLASILDGALGVGPAAWDASLLTLGADSGEAIAAALERGQRSGRGVLLLIDHLEDIATLPSEAKASAAMSDLARICGAGAPPNVRVVGCVQRDLLGAVAEKHADIHVALTRGAFTVAPLTSAALGDGIDRALAAYGFSFEDEKLAASVQKELDGVSMLGAQFALARLWELRDDTKKELTRAAVEAIGGVRGALEKHVAAALALLDRGGPDARVAAREVLRALATPARTRRPPTIANLETLARPELVRRVVGTLEAARLVTRDGDAVALAHEGLFARGSALAGWLDGTQEARPRGQPLDHAKRAAAPPVGLLLDAPRAQAQRATRLARIGRRERVLTLALAAIAALALGAAWVSHLRAEREEGRARGARDDSARFAQRAKATDFALRLSNDRNAKASVAVYEAAVKTDPSWEQGHLQLSIAYLARAREVEPDDDTLATALFEKALNEAAAAVSLGVGSRGYFQKGLVYEEAFDHDAARHALLEAARIATDADRFEMHVALAKIATGEHRWTDAADEASRALAERPDAGAFYLRALARSHAGDLDAALADASHALDGDGAVPPQAGATRDLLLRSDIHLLRGEAREAGQDLATATLRTKPSPYVLDRLARWALREGATGRAATLADAAVEGGKPLASVYVGRAMVRAAMNKPDDARADLASALRIDPLDEEATRAEAGGGVAPLPVAGTKRDLSPREHLDRTATRLAKGELELAAYDAETAAEEDPLFAEALLLRLRIGLLLPAGKRDATRDLELVKRAAPDLAAQAAALETETENHALPTKDGGLLP